MRFIVRTLLVLGLAPLLGHAAPKDTLCTDQPSRLAAYTGHYAQEALLDAITSLRIWQPPGTVSALDIAADGQVTVIQAWHEALSVAAPDKMCFSIQDSELTLLRHTMAFEKLLPGTQFRKVARGGLDDTKVASAYSKMLFSGCYITQQCQEWCFTDNLLRIDGSPRSAHLQLDNSELPPNGATLRVEGDERFWHFMPLPKGRWQVYRTEWASCESYTPPSAQRPWQILTPQVPHAGKSQ